jgi:hypothetical protein
MQQLLPRATLANAYPISVTAAERARGRVYATSNRALQSRLHRLALSGLGDAATLGQQIGAYGGVAAGLTTVGLTLAKASNAIPVVGPIIAGVATIVSLVVSGSGCGQTCVISTDLVNKLEPALQQNVQGYLALPTPRPRAAQVAALANFDTAWAWLSSSQACGAPQLGDAGKRCITDRQSGACTWHDSSGKCWNWFVGYRDPIANDPQVTDTAASDTAIQAMGSDPTATLAQAGGGASLDSKTGLLLVGAALLIAGAAGN